MAIFTASGITYPKALELIETLKHQGIDSNITTGGVAIHALPDQINQAKEVCSRLGASFDAGYSMHEENIFIQNGSIDHVAQVTNDAIAIIKEWE